MLSSLQIFQNSAISKNVKACCLGTDNYPLTATPNTRILFVEIVRKTGFSAENLHPLASTRSSLNSYTFI